MPNDHLCVAVAAAMLAMSACRTHEISASSSGGNPQATSHTQATAAPSEDTMSTVRSLSDIAKHAGTRVTVEGDLKQVPFGKGGPEHLATVLQLADGTQIWVTYGEAPPGWERFFGKPVTVEGVVWDGPPPTALASVGGPHISDWAAPRAR